ncbi:YslB family protein [Pseudoneobacillus sp. C159]
MKKLRSMEEEISLHEISVPSFGYELIREELLSNILGKDAPEILYWAGKQLARNYLLQNLDEISAFFSEAAWGTLTVKKEHKNELIFELTSELISRRLKLKQDIHFRLEAGFLAQQIENQLRMVAEANVQIHKKAGIIEITVRWDQKDLF